MIIDAMGKACPMPVIMTKKQLDAGNRNLTVKVDNTTAVQNLTKLGESMNIPVTSRGEGKEFEVYFNGGEAEAPKKEEEKSASTTDTAYFIGKEFIGDGDRDFGNNLMKMALYTLSEADKAPKYLLFMNGGVKLLQKDEEQICENVKAMEEKGTKVLVCGACLNYYGITEELGAGEVSNMYVILGAMEDSAKVVTL